jgi:hypothetical protein
MSDLSQQSGAKRTLIRSLSQFYEYTSLMLGSARQRPAAVVFAVGVTIEHEPHLDVVGQHSDLDAAAQTAQARSIAVCQRCSTSDLIPA